MSSKEYLPYPVTAEWRGQVRAALDDRPRGEQERLREYIVSRGLKCSSGELADLLSGKAQTSVFVEPVHEYLKWSPPLPPTASVDAGETIYGYLRMTQAQRDLLDRAADVLKGESGDQARVALAEMLKLFAPPKE